MHQTNFFQDHSVKWFVVSRVQQVLSVGDMIWLQLEPKMSFASHQLLHNGKANDTKLIKTKVTVVWTSGKIGGPANV